MLFKLSCRPSYLDILLIQLLLITELASVCLAKRGGWKGGSVGRGTSNTGGINGGNKPSSGTSFGSGGSAAAGVAGAVLGSVVSHQLTKSHYRYAYGGRDYYYGDRYYRPSYSYSRKCVFTLETQDYKSYDDGYQVKELVFECNSRNERCCGMECCSNGGGMSWWDILLATIAVISLLATCVFLGLGMKFRARRQATHKQYSSAAAGDASVLLQEKPEGISGAKAYTVHYASGPTCPAGNQWQQPSYPQAYGGYPPGTPAYGFNVQPGPYPKQY